MVSSFRAFVVNKTNDEFTTGVQEINLDKLGAGEVVIKVAYSGVNYKDGLATLPNGRILTRYPMIPGIDLSGTVVSSEDARFKEGDEVLATSYDLGMAHEGGFCEYARVPAAWVVPLPSGMSLRDAMIGGTAAFTAALAIYKLELNGLKPDNGPVLVTGATGGVGSFAIAMLSNLGYSVAGSTGKESEHDYLRQLGASEIVSRNETSAESTRPMERERWAGSIDNVGGGTLAYLARTTKAEGSIASVGLTGGNALNTTVYPFILRGIHLLGINSQTTPMELRRELWQRIATDLKPRDLEMFVAGEHGLDDVKNVTADILHGKIRGRALIKL
jgi:acrylyl-CoA reductase (NADPH)